MLMKYYINVWNVFMRAGIKIFFSVTQKTHNIYACNKCDFKGNIFKGFTA